MLPAALIQLDTLPLTPNGKIDRRALPDPVQVGPYAEHAHTAPRTALEALLVTIWRDVLGVEQLSIDGNFFEIGGHSLTVPRRW
ncbi:MAG: hypothetical protein HC893_15580 [Chloroflexaceae bacterium]|nr:hypothetical protein [Chloroflexaceae bacterium]